MASIAPRSDALLQIVHRRAVGRQDYEHAPRRLSAERLDRIDADWRAAARPYDRPDTGSSARQLPTPEEQGRAQRWPGPYNPPAFRGGDIDMQ
jgi:hypothetical protein